MSATVWAIQILLAAVFLAHGWLFIAPPARAAARMNESLPRWFQVFLGVAEVLAALGLTLPSVTGILPWLTSWAAAGVMLVALSASIVHLRRGEFRSTVVTLLLLAMAAFVVYAR
ncbi:MAG: DoxX family protein [Vicinamibacterales bacterium]